MALYITDTLPSSATQSNDQQYLSIQALVAAGLIDQAIQALEEQIVLSGRYYNDLGVLLYKKGDKEKSLACYRQAVALAPDNSNYQKNLADFCCVENQDFEGALSIYNDILTKNPADIEALLNIGMICEILGHKDDASFFYSRILTIETNHLEAKRRLQELDTRHPIEEADPAALYEEAQSLTLAGRQDEAIGLLETLLVRHPEFALAHNDLGVLYLQAEKPEIAGLHYEKAVQLAPANKTFRKNLADFCCMILDDSERALSIYQELLVGNPRDTELLMALAIISFKLGRIEDAQACITRIFEINPDHADAKQFLEMIGLSVESSPDTPVEERYSQVVKTCAEGNTDLGIQQLNSLLLFNPDFALAHNDLGVLYMNKGMVEQAAYHYGKAAEIDRSNTLFRKNFADFLLVVQHDHQRALQIYHELLADSPDDVDALLGIGTVCKMMGSIADAGFFFNRVVEIEPWNMTAWQQIEGLIDERLHAAQSKPAEELYQEAVNLSAEGAVDAAIRKLESVIREEPDFAPAYNDLGVLYTQTANHDKALEYYRKAVELRPDNIVFQKNLAEFCFVIGNRTDEAVQIYITLLQSHPTDVELLLALGIISCRMNQWNEARLFIDRALELDPENTVAKEQLQIILNQREFAPVSSCDNAYRLQKKNCTVSNKEGTCFPLTSIVIPVFNKCELTRQCYQRIVENTNPSLFELIFVDNGSTDGTSDFLSSLPRQHHVIRNADNRGFAAACNQGAQAATGTFILFLNNDTEPQPRWLESLVQMLECDSTAGVVGSKLIYPDGTIQHAGVMLVKDEVLNVLLSPWHIGYGAADTEEFNHVRQCMAVTAACMLIRRELFVKVKGFDEGYWNGYEDVDLCFKVLHAGYRIYYQPESCVVHHESKSGPERRIREEENLQRLQEHWAGLITPQLVRTNTNKFEPFTSASIVIVTYNSEVTISKCLESVIQHLRPGDEVVVVDNDSRDKTAKLVNFLIKEHPHCTFVRNAKNIGFSAGTNVGIARSSNPYVILLNPDTIVTSNWIDHLLAHFIDYSVGAVGPVSNHAGGAQNMDLYQHAQIAPDAPLEKISQLFYSWNEGRAIESKLLIGFCLMVRRDVLNRLGPLDEQLFLGNDDLELSWRLRINNFRLKVATDTFIYHAGQHSFHSEKKEKTDRLVQESTDALNAKLTTYYGVGKVPSPEALWGIDWFKPSQPTGHETKGMKEHAERPPVSIVILTFNQLPLTQECVESIRRHTPEPHEIIFVDNGSKDGTVKWLQHLVKENKQYQLINNKKNLGFAAGCNQGVAKASGDYLLLLNNDVVVTEGWLSGMLECFKENPGIGIVGPMTNSTPGPQQVMDPGYRTPEERDQYARTFRQRNRHRRIPVKLVVGFCMLFSRSVLDQLGPLDERYSIGNYEDDDFCLRASLAGYQSVIAGDVFVHHYGGSSFSGNSINYSATMAANRKLFDKKWNLATLDEVTAKKLATHHALIKAAELRQKGLIDDAAEILVQEGIAFSPEDPRPYLFLIEMFIDVSRYDEALSAIAELPELVEGHVRHSLKGYCQAGLELLAEAAGSAAASLSLSGSYAPALNLQGVLAHARGDTAAAMASFRKAITADESYGEPYTNLGVLLWATGSHDEALDLLEQGFVLNPLGTDLLERYAAAATALEAFERAEIRLRDAAEIYPKSRTIAFKLIDMLLRQGKTEQAMATIEQSLTAFSADKGLIDAALQVRELCGPREISEAARKTSISLCMIVKNEQDNLLRSIPSVSHIVDEIIVVDTGSTDRTREVTRALGAKVFDYEWNGSFADARNASLEQAHGTWILVLDADETLSSDDCNKLRSLAGGSEAAAYFICQRNYTDQSNAKGWTANSGEYLQEESGTGWYPADIVRFFANDTRIRFANPVHELVDQSLKKIGIKPRKSGIAVHHYGKLNKEREQAKQQAYYELGRKKLAENPDDAAALLELAIQATELKRFDEALELWRRVLSAQPNLAEAYLNIGYIQLTQGNYSEALQSSKRAMSLDPNLKEAVFNYAKCELFVGDPEKAVTILKKLVEKIDYPPAVALLSTAYYCKGLKTDGNNLLRTLHEQNYNCREYLEEYADTLISLGKTDMAQPLLTAANACR